MNGVVLYPIWLVFLAIMMFQGAATGKIPYGGRGGHRNRKAWTLPSWVRFACLFLGIIASGTAIFLTVRYFSPVVRLMS
jgi:hypothetical protein